ncbi:MAG TPA: histidine kinase, partial [Balneolaceae bacterium]|nr:histidine kinase [Balneolaceae bacterium]
SFSKHKILQILGNLISNSIKFTPENGSVEVDLSIKRPEIELVASVKDSGVGMTEAQINDILADEAESTQGTDHERGFGFGFKLARHLVETMKGTLQIESEKGKGTHITISIPLEL